MHSYSPRAATAAPTPTAGDAPVPFYVVRMLGWNHRWYRYRTVEPGWDGDHATNIEEWASAFSTEGDALRHALGLRKDCFQSIGVVRVTDRATFLQSESGDSTVVTHEEQPTTIGQFRYVGTHPQASALEHATYDLWTLYGTDQGDVLVDALRSHYDERLPSSHYP